MTLERGADLGAVRACAGGSGPCAASSAHSPGRSPSSTGTSRAPCGCCSPTGPSASDAGAALHSEVRVAPVDRRAAVYLRALEPFIAAFQGLIGLETLSLAVRRAERR